MNDYRLPMNQDDQDNPYTVCRSLVQTGENDVERAQFSASFSNGESLTSFRTPSARRCENWKLYLFGVVVLALMAAMFGYVVKQRNTEPDQQDDPARQFVVMLNNGTIRTMTVSEVPGHFKDITNQWHRVSSKDTHSYRLFPEKRTYWKAKSSCESLHGILASTGLRKEETKLDIIHSIPLRIRKYENVWIGLHEDSSGAWTWSDGTRAEGLNFEKENEIDRLNTHTCASTYSEFKLEEDWCGRELMYLCERNT